jgi:hypothetical protein
MYDCHWANFSHNLFLITFFANNSYTEFNENVKRQTSARMWYSLMSFFSYFVNNALQVAEYRAMEHFMSVR